MGGNAFPRLPLGRVKRQFVLPTLQYVVNTLNLPGFDVNYAMDNLMGSAGKQADSGDLDFAMNDKPARFVGDPVLPVFDLRAVAQRARQVLPEGHVRGEGLKGGQFQSAWPVAGNPALGMVQVDFLAGDPEWLKFSHWSPGKDVSPWKGVMNSTFLGVLAKRQKEFEAFDSDGVRYARVGLHFDLELGLYRKWELRLRKGNGMSNVQADLFETRMPGAPRFSRMGYLTNPAVVLNVLFERPVEFSQVDTFEKLVVEVKKSYPGEYEDLFERFLVAFQTSAGKNDYSVDEVREAFRD